MSSSLLSHRKEGLNNVWEMSCGGGRTFPPGNRIGGEGTQKARCMSQEYNKFTEQKQQCVRRHTGITEQKSGSTRG